MKRIELLKDVGPYKKGQTISIDENGAAELIQSKRGKAVDEKDATEPPSDS